jgi:hypothetical protein
MLLDVRDAVLGEHLRGEPAILESIFRQRLSRGGEAAERLAECAHSLRAEPGEASAAKRAFHASSSP